MRTFPSLLSLPPAAILLIATISLCQSTAGTFQNPLLDSGPDPWVITSNGYYFYMNTTGKNLTIWKTADITDLRHAQKKIVWTPPPAGPSSHEIWAPELHRIDGKWYIYFAADAGSNEGHRIWIVENDAADPTEGDWRLQGKFETPGDHWAIDPSVFENKGRHYIVWSGWEGNTNGIQKIFLARLATPTTISGKPVVISQPDFSWEKVGDLTHSNKIDALPHVDVNEGPEILQHGGNVMLIYSASGCWTDYYELGVVTASANADLLDPASWVKSTHPVFWQSPEASVYGPGHNTFFKSPDGKEDWILYHANSATGQGCGPMRSPRAQPFTWKADGSPDFGRPLPTSQQIPKPSR